MQATRLASVPVLIFAAALTLPGQSDNLTTAEARDHIGEKATVCGRAVGFRYAETSKGESTFVDLDGRYPRQPFTIVILGENREKFEALASKYHDQNICVTAEITRHGGAPEAVVTNAEEIQTQQESATGQGPVSSLPSQAAQPADSAQPPATQSQAQSADSASVSEPLIERAREAAFQFSEKLPHFICVERMSRFTQRGREDETPLDVVSAEIIYVDGAESYRNVKINDHATDKSLEEIDGSWSTGEFASTLLEIFDPRTDAQFRSAGASSISGFSAQLYDFQVRGENSRWKIESGSQTLTPAYGGSLWVDPKTARVLRIEMQARSIPSDFPMDTVESAVDYSYVTIAGLSFLLPVHAESLGCERGSRQCSHNIIDFHNYHEFKVDSRILSPAK